MELPSGGTYLFPPKTAILFLIITNTFIPTLYFQNLESWGTFEKNEQYFIGLIHNSCMNVSRQLAGYCP